MDKKIRILIIFLTVLYFGIIVFMLLYPFSRNEKLPRSIIGIRSDYVAHFLMFLPSSFIIWVFIHSFIDNVKRSTYVISIVLSIAFAILTELGQKYLTVSRNAELYDFVADFFGIIFGAIILFIFSNRVKKCLFNKIK
jgi:VanZ family protein